MKTTEERVFYHNLERYRLAGLNMFINHAEEYFKGLKQIPVSKTGSIDSDYVLFTFSDDLLKRFVNDIDSIKKPYEVAIKYGFRGHSKGGKNGIFYQRKEDQRMLRKTDKLINKHLDDVVNDLEIKAKDDIDNLEKIKIVWHCQENKRVVGAYNPKKQRMVFLDFAEY